MNDDTRHQSGAEGASDGHGAIAQLLPDLALELLDTPDAELAARHLGSCASCRAELDELRAAATLLAHAAPQLEPTSAARDALFQRIARDRHGAAPETTATAARPIRPDNPPARPWFGRLLAAAAAVLVLGLLGSTVWLQRELRGERVALATADARSAENGELMRLLSDPRAAQPLMAAGEPSRSVGHIFVRPDSDMAFLVAYGLPPLPQATRYQLWLLRPGGSRDSGGMFAVDAAGDGQLMVRAPANFAEYSAVGITVEPWTGSNGPTTPRVAGAVMR